MWQHVPWSFRERVFVVGGLLWVLVIGALDIGALIEDSLIVAQECCVDVGMWV